jgi:asparagine synthase (glutamine-hydrolysing)
MPLGCFLSGGVDSSAVVSAAVSVGSRPETLTVSFSDGEDEAPIAASTAAALGLSHRSVGCAPEEMLAVFSRWPQLAADPFADPSLAPTSLVSRVARERWTVALSGDGGDELLSGYPRLRFMPRLEAILGLPRTLRQGMVAALPARRWAAKVRAAIGEDEPWKAYQALQGVWPARSVARLMGRDGTGGAWPPGLLERLSGFGPWQRYRLLDALTFLPERVLAKVDRASMEHSLEVRVPLLDHRIVEHLLTLPGSLGRGKGVLRRALAGLGGPPPPRRKRGFEVPLARWLRGPLRGWVEERVLGATAADLGLDQVVLRQTWEEHQLGRSDHAERLQSVAVLVAWAEAWL